MVKANSFIISEFLTRFYYNLFTIWKPFSPTVDLQIGLSLVEVVAGVREEAVERGDEDVEDELGRVEGGVGAEVGDVRNLKPFILLENWNIKL